MENLSDKYKHINGWGIDADPENEPTYPMKNYTGDDHQRLNWERPELQKTNTEILQSNERPHVTAVFGTPVPPTGLSGVIRRKAFKYSESSYGHWLPLILADRINVIEGIIEDIGRGYLPNIFKEKGWSAEWKHNPKSIIKKAIIGVLITAVAVTVIRKRKTKYN